MLILCSNGLSSKQLLSSIVPFVDKGDTSALVVTADNQYKDKNYHVPRCMEELQSLGLTVDLFDIDISPVEQLLSCDVVEFIGGNPFYLLDSIHRHNATDTLQEIATKKILIGWSAAAFVFGPSLELVNQYSPDMNFVGLSDLKALSLTPICVLPHYNRFLDRYDQFEDKCREYEISHDTVVIRLNDGDGLLLQGDQRTVIRAQ